MFLSKLIKDPPSGNDKAIDKALKPVKLPISKTFFVLDVLINVWRNCACEIEICNFFWSPRLRL